MYSTTGGYYEIKIANYYSAARLGRQKAMNTYYSLGRINED